MKKIITLLTSTILASTLILGATAKASPVNVNAENVTATSAANGKNVIAYFPNWGMYNQNHQMITVGDMPWDKLTVINHAFFTVNKSFKLETTDIYADFDKPMPHSEGWEGLRGFMGEYKYYKQLYPDVKVLVSVGGWTRGENFHAMAKTKETRKIFTDSVVEFLKQYPFIDGIDIDWEYPGIDRAPDKNDEWDRGCPGGPEDKVNYTLLLKEIRESYNANGLNNKMLTIANSAGYNTVANQEPDKYIQYLDYINVMTYDLHGAWEGKTNHHAAIYPNPNDPSGTSPVDIKNKFNTQEAMKLYTDTYKIPAEKLNVGTPFYSRGWGGVVKNTGTNGLFADATGKHIGAWDNPNSPGGQYGWFQLKKMENTGGWVKYRDNIAKVPYLYNESLGAMLTYEDEESLSERCDFVTKNNYGGMIIWEISGDDIKADYPMTSIIANKIGPKYPADEAKKASVIVDKPVNGGQFKLTINIPKLSNAVSAKIYENGKLIDTIAVNPTNSSITTIDKSYTKPYGKYTYRVDLTSAAGKITSSSVDVTCEVMCTTAPVEPYLEHSNWVGAPNFVMTMTNYGGENGSEWRLYQDGVMIFKQDLVYGGVGRQTASYNVKDVTNGKHVYYCELVNPKGATKSKEVIVEVTSGKDPLPGDEVNLEKVSSLYNTSKSSPNFDAKCDLNLDGIIDIFDIVMVAKKMP